MNQLTSQQRKLIYMGCIVALMIPVVLLGLPAGRIEQGSAGQPESAGRSEFQGHLATLRSKYDLGETSLGNVDPASSTMSLVLFGFRGIAASVLWNQADKQKSMKNWHELEGTVESIVLLQPHFRNVWAFQAWNLAFNVSAEFDDVKDRFYWVKRGAKFLERGINRNRDVPDLYHDMGDFIGRKVGYSDERDFFRKFFMHDPDESLFDQKLTGVPDPDDDADPRNDWTDNSPDPAINPNGEDNYLRAVYWYDLANQVLLKSPASNHKMAYIIFMSSPYKAKINYARARSREGLFDEVTRRAWDDAYKSWTTEYARMIFPTRGNRIVKLEPTAEELKTWAKREGVSLDQKQEDVAYEQDLVNYRFWKTLCEVERLPEMVEARRKLAEARKVWRELGDAVRADQLLLEGMAEFESILTNFRDGILLDHDEGIEFIEDAIDAVLFWKMVNAGRRLPEKYPLQSIYESTEERIIGIRKEREVRFQEDLLNE